MENLKKQASKCMESIKQKGIDKAYCYVSSRVINEFNIDSTGYYLFRTVFDNSLSVTLYNKGKKGVVSLNRFDDESISKAVDNAVAASESASPDDAWDIAPVSRNDAFVSGCPEPDIPRLFDRAVEFLGDISACHPKIALEQMIIKHSRTDGVYMNSNGVEYTSLSGSYTVYLDYSAQEGEKSSSFFSSWALTDSLDKPFIELGCIEEDLSNVEKQIFTRPVEGKFTGTVVFPPQALNSLLESALYNFCGNTTILDGTSIWKDKLDKQVTDSRITISASPLDERIICGERFNSEGFRSENYDIIKDGVLKSFMLSSYVANKTCRERARNSSDSFIMAPGDTTVSEIIKGIDRGILVGRLSGGEPATNGDFSAVAKNSFYIENGKITNAISETMISGNLAEILNNVRAISKEVICDGSTVLPYAAFDNITISGK